MQCESDMQLLDPFDQKGKNVQLQGLYYGNTIVLFVAVVVLAPDVEFVVFLFAKDIVVPFFEGTSRM